MYRQQRLGRRQRTNHLRQRVDDEAGLLRYVALSQQRGIRPVAFADEPKALNRRSQLAAVLEAPVASQREPLQHHEQHQSEEPGNGDVGSFGVKPRVRPKHPPVYAGTPRSFCHGLLASICRSTASRQPTQTAISRSSPKAALQTGRSSRSLKPDWRNR